MDLTEYTEMLRRELGSVTRFGGEEFARTTEMLADALDSSVRLTGSEPEFVVTPTAGAQADEPAEADPGEASDDMTRITLRLSGPLKARVDAEAAAAGLSVNAWLVRAITRALDPAPGRPSRVQRGPGTRFTGYQRG